MPLADRLNLLNTTFADLRGPLVLAFEQRIPTLDWLRKKAKRNIEGGTYIERDISGAPAGVGTGIFSGGERLKRQYKEKIERYRVEPHRLVGLIEIPKKDLVTNSGKLAIIKLIKAHPREWMVAAAQDYNRYLLVGNTSGNLAFLTADMLGFTTFNGQFTTGIGLGVSDGLLDFQSPATQGDTVQNVQKSNTIGHYNQYGAITTWATNGQRVQRDTYRRAAHFAMKKMNDGPQTTVMDPDVYANFDEDRESKVRIQVVEDKTEKGDTMVIPFMNGDAVFDLDLDRSQFTGVAANGVSYGFNYDFMELVYQQEPELSDFQDAGPTHDTVYAKFECQGNLIITKFPAQFCVSGGAV